MKKICCMLMACMMIFTGISMPTFAMEGNATDVQSTYNIANISDENIIELKKEVDYTFYGLVEDKSFSASSGAVFNAMCEADLLSKYYAINGQARESRTYQAKGYVIASEFILYSLNGEENLFAKYELSLYYLNKSYECLQKNEDTELYKSISKEIRCILGKKFVRDYEKYNRLKLNKEEKLGLILKIRKEIPKNEEELNLLLESAGDLFNGYNFYLLDDDNYALRDENPDFTLGDLPDQDLDELDENEKKEMIYEREQEERFNKACSENLVCSLIVDGNSTKYRLVDVLKTVLKGNFEFGPGGAHIAFGNVMQLNILNNCDLENLSFAERAAIIFGKP